MKDEVVVDIIPLTTSQHKMDSSMVSHNSYESYDFLEESVWKEEGRIIISSSKKNTVKSSPKKSDLNKHADRDSIVYILPSIESPNKFEQSEIKLRESIIQNLFPSSSAAKSKIVESPAKPISIPRMVE